MNQQSQHQINLNIRCESESESVVRIVGNCDGLGRTLQQMTHRDGYGTRRAVEVISVKKCEVCGVSCG
ncbi:hypothetical protein A2U01_0050514, partial [Trifolium medium]|nr:hypothetical protein [Trifolium medium]